MKKCYRRCPACRSSGIGLYAGGITGSYECRKCGYIGPLILELKKNKNRARD
ncbi:hypothetical protein HYZ41_01270 [archaeon]|nr:hypothetical protein [archaeon]